MKFTRPIRAFRGPPLRPARPGGLYDRMAAKFQTRAFANMTSDQRFEFEERVAICIHDGGLSEAEAIRTALNDAAGKCIL